MDAAECPPTFGVPREQVVGVIAGGEKCMVRAAEAQEDDAAAGENDLRAHALCEKDVVIGISASGGAAYVVGALEYGNRLIMMHEGNIVMDHADEAKQALKLDDILGKFNEISIECGN
jgi:N-acetylmuramic acid 6-phosphate (MurNAc-6-P) etherase